MIGVRPEFDRTGCGGGRCRSLTDRRGRGRPARIEIGVRVIKVPAIFQRVAGCAEKRHHTDEEKSHAAMQPNARAPVNEAQWKRALRAGALSRTVPFRQGLWTEDLRTPPEQECSNGSLILFAVVLWRTFFCLTPADAKVFP